MFRIFLIIIAFFANLYTASAVILVDPRGNWDDLECQRLFATIGKYSILPTKGLSPKQAHRFLESQKTEKDFVAAALHRKFPEKDFRIHDVPATLVDLGLLHKTVYSIYSQSQECSKELRSPDNWSLNTQEKTYFALGYLLIPLIENEKSYESIGSLLCENMHPFFKDNTFNRICRDFHSDHSLLKRGLREETLAIQRENFVWFRGTEGVTLDGFGCLLDGFINNDKITEVHQLNHLDYFHATRAFSFGLSLLAGYVFDREACAFSYIHPQEKYSHNGNNIGYAIRFPKRDLVRETTKGIWKFPNINPAFQILGRGEYFHPRSRGGSLSGPSREHYKKTRDYHTLGRQISNLLIENSTLIYWRPQEIMSKSSPEKENKTYVYQKNPFIEAHKALHNFLFPEPYEE